MSSGRVRLFTGLMLVACASGQVANETPAFGTTVVIPAGLRGTVYLIPENTTVLPDFRDKQVEPVGQVWTNSLNVPPRHWRAGFPGLTNRFEWFAIDYQGTFWIEDPGRYAFALLSDDGSRLFIDDVPVIDNDCQHPPDLRLAAVRLEGGGHRLRVSYFQGPRDCLALILAVAGPDRHWKLFDTQEFRPPSNPENWQYSESSALTLVATEPEEAQLTQERLFKLLAATDPLWSSTNRNKFGGRCSYPPVRTCGN